MLLENEIQRIDDNATLPAAGEMLLPVGEAALGASLALPEDATGLVILAQSSGSGRFNPRTRRIAGLLYRGRMATLLMGGLTLGQVRRGVAQTTTLGYWMGKPHAGKGYMAKAVRAAAGFAFQTLRLHRIEAACLPHNTASIRLLEGVGFTREGYARAYLKINGVWQDHVLYGLLENDPVRPSLPR